MFPTKISIATLALAGVLGAQDFAVSGPVSGAVFDEQAKAVRQIAGVPGAAYLRGSLAVADQGSVSPDGRFAVLAADGELTLLDLISGRVSKLGAAKGLDAIAWGADSKSVAVEAGRVALWTGLDAQPEAAPLAAFEGDATALAVSGRSVAAAAKGGVWLLTADGSRLIAPVEDPSALAIAGGTLYVADSARKEILAVRNFDGSAEISLIANETAGIDSPAALAVESGLLYEADASRKVLVLNLATGEVVRQLDLDFEPGRLEAFARGMYRMDSRRAAGQPVQILKAGAEPAVYFVPAEASLED